MRTACRCPGRQSSSGRPFLIENRQGAFGPGLVCGMAEGSVRAALWLSLVPRYAAAWEDGPGSSERLSSGAYKGLLPTLCRDRQLV